MICLGPGEDENIVQVDNDKLVDVRVEDVCHEMLEGSRGIGETEGYYCELVVTKLAVEP